MAIRMPRTVREALGEEAATDLADWFETMFRERAVSRDEYREILSRLDILEHDVAGLKDEVKELRSDMNRRFERMDKRFDQMYNRMLVMTRWTVGMLAFFGTIVTILIAVSRFGGF